MKSITNQLKDYINAKSDINLESSKLIIKSISYLESDYYQLKNDHADALETLQKVRYELDQEKSNDRNALTDISKKLSKTLKSAGEDEMLVELQLDRAKIIDHFTLAYMADLGLKPSQIKLIQGTNDGYFEIYFVENSKIIMLGES